MRLARLALVAGAAALFAAGAARADALFESIAAAARAEAGAPYAAPPALKRQDYDAWRDIRFRPDRALWRKDGAFEAMLFHAGRHEPVRIHEVTPEGVREVAYDPALFDFGPRSRPDGAPRAFAGLRLHYPLNTGAYRDELVAFLGASYFRALGAGQLYGLSARGLAIDTVPGPEEFPRFKAFWIERPAADARAARVYAQLDSPRATGAYRFTIHPGRDTEVEVRARIFLRERVATLGIAPLTSMYLHGENQPRPGQFRPEVHDSDGLLVAAGGEWIWRPLVNPPRPLVSSFAADALQGFGLMQRDRDYRSYQDAEARYEKRPSAWVTPVGDWGPGRVELLQLPTDDEFHDNVVAYWVPATPPAPGEPFDIAWRIAWQGDAPQAPPGAWTAQTRTGMGAMPLPAETMQYVVEFTGPALAGLAPDAAVEAVVSTNDNASVLEKNTYRNPANGHWRLSLQLVRLDPARPVELRAFLRNHTDTLTETWAYLIPPE